MSDSDDADLPPLEDASELVKKIKERKSQKEVKKISRDLLDLELNEEKYVPDQIKLFSKTKSEKTVKPKAKKVCNNNNI